MEDPLHISTILAALHTIYPALNYPQYEQRLRQQGICYAINAAAFEASFFISKVKMAEGAVAAFMAQVNKQITKEKEAKVRRKQKGKKKARTSSDGENVSPASET